MAGLREEFVSLEPYWKAIYDSTEPHQQPLPGQWESKLTGIQRICALRCIRPDKVVLAVQDFVAKVGAVEERSSRSRCLLGAEGGAGEPF